MRLFLLFLLLQQSPARYEVPEAYEVYSAVLPGEWPSRVNHELKLTIVQETKFQPMCLDPGVKSKALLNPVLADYVRNNQQPMLLRPQFVIQEPYDLVPKQSNRAVSWTELSAVGFNADKTIAVVYAGHVCGSLCGGGSFHVLQKRDNKWLPLAWDGMACVWGS